MRRGAGAALVARIERAPDQVVWIYAQQNTVNGIHAARFVRVGFADGSIDGLNVQGEMGALAAMALLARIAPRATLGYSDDNERLFRHAPAALLA
jgi:hypothetical protein